MKIKTQTNNSSYKFNPSISLAFPPSDNAQIKPNLDLRSNQPDNKPSNLANNSDKMPSTESLKTKSISSIAKTINPTNMLHRGQIYIDNHPIIKSQRIQMIADQLIQAAETLKSQLTPLSFPEPVAYTYNPLDYAWERHCDYLKTYANSPKKVLFLGMNPGPYGMAQTGIPFGEIPHVRDWLKISGPVNKPNPEHPKRPITGFDCERSEVSGRRLWGLFSDLFDTAENFFQNHFVANFCPLVWMKDTGANITPDKLPRDVMEPVDKACLAHLSSLIETLQPEILVGVGAFAEKQLAAVKSDHHHLGKILHPSPASPAANRDFSGTAAKQLRELKILS